MTDISQPPATKNALSKPAKLVRLLKSVLDPRAYLHAFKMVNYYNYTHVAPLREIKIGSGAALSPDTGFTNPERIEVGDRLQMGARSCLWAGPSRGRILIGDDVLIGPDVLVTAAEYRFNDGSPVTKQPMDEADIEIGNDVWLAAKVVVLAGAKIGEGSIIGGGAIVRGEIPPFSIAVGAPARVVGQRKHFVA